MAPLSLCSNQLATCCVTSDLSFRIIWDPVITSFCAVVKGEMGSWHTKNGMMAEIQDMASKRGAHSIDVDAGEFDIRGPVGV